MNDVLMNFGEHLPILEVSDGCIVSKAGDITVGLRLEKPEIFTLGEKEFGALHESFVKAMKLLSPGTIVHLQDIYREDVWEPTRVGDRGLLGEASDRYFKGRGYLRHDAYIYFTRRPAGRQGVDSGGSNLLRRFLVPPETLDQQMVAELREQVKQFTAVIAESGLVGLSALGTEELGSSVGMAGLIEQYCYLLDDERPIIRDISFWPGMTIGTRHAVVYTLADAEKLPAQCSPAVPYEKYSSEQTKVYVGFLAGLGLLLPCSHVVNQYIVIGDGPATWQRLERKRLRMQSLSRYSRGNAAGAAAAEEYLQEAVSEHRRPVRMHLNIMAWTDGTGSGVDRPGTASELTGSGLNRPGSGLNRPSSLSELRTAVVSAIAAMDIIPHEETVGAPQLWWAGIPGNSGELPVNECWDTFLEQGCCFLQFESSYRDAAGPLVLRLGDRLTGRPVHVDLDIEPRLKNWTHANNALVLASSGAGKSFFVAMMTHAFCSFGGHVVMVDVGGSYSGLCRLLKGKYFTYEKERPLSFNPFFIGDALDTERREAVISLLMALWKRADEMQYRSEHIALSNMLDAYFQRLAGCPEIFPGFDSFYEFLRDVYSERMRRDGVRQKEFDLENFLYVVRPYYAGGEFDFLLNARVNIDLLHEPLVVFELDRIKNHAILLPVVSLVIAELFLAKTRKLLGVRKMLVMEEAWKAIANAGMATNIQEWEKTLRKYMAKIVLVSQEIEDIVDSPIIKKSIIANSDVKILLDMNKFQNRFGEIQDLLGITEKQKAEILSVNRGHAAGGRPYKDVWIGLGAVHSCVYRVEVSPEEYWVYTSEQGDKVRVEEYVARYGSYERAIEELGRG